MWFSREEVGFVGLGVFGFGCMLDVLGGFLNFWCLSLSFGDFVVTGLGCSLGLGRWFYVLSWELAIR